LPTVTAEEYADEDAIEQAAYTYLVREAAEDRKLDTAEAISTYILPPILLTKEWRSRVRVSSNHWSTSDGRYSSMASQL
jgi:hypothetical protein